MTQARDRDRPPCAICDGTNATVRLCRTCRADPANAGWSERTMHLDRAWIDSPPGDRHASELDARQRLADMRDRRLRQLAPRTQQILQLVGFYCITDYRRPRGKARGQREWIQYRRPLHLAEVAFLVGVSITAVRRTLLRYEPLMRAALSTPPRRP